MVNQEQELIQQLASDKRSLRIQAMVKLTRVGSSEAAIKALTFLASKGDREESFYASQAITKISQKLGRAVEQSPITNNSTEQGSNQSNSKTITERDFLVADKSRAPELLQYIRANYNFLSEDILPSVGVFLGKHGDKTDVPFIKNYLSKHQDSLALPYVNALEKLDKDTFIQVLPLLLASNESLVRSKAVMALRKVDPEEAERHFLSLLASKQAENRLAAIEISFLFPFERVRDYILSLLAEEKDPDVFRACATILASNPSKEIALKILDILESLPVNQRKPATSVFNIVCVAITSARVLPANEATPQALIKTWKEQRLQSFLNDLEIQLSTPSYPNREGIISWLEKNRPIAKVAEFIEHLALNPQTEDVYMRLTGQKASVALSQTPSSEVKVTDESSFEEAEYNKPVPALCDENESNASANANEVDDVKTQIKHLKTLDIGQFNKEKSHILDIAESSSTPVLLRVEALNTLLKLCPTIRIKSTGIKALAENDTKIKTAGFKILERIAPEVLKEQLSDLLLSSDNNIRVRAVRFGLKIDERSSIEALQKIIASSDQNVRSNAISCLALCPFDKVYQILIRALKVESHQLVAKQITSILVSNPDASILSMIDKLSITTENPSIKMVISQARNELEEVLATMSGGKKPKLEEIDVFEKNSNHAPEAAKPYSVENVRTIKKKQPKEEVNDKQGPIDWLIVKFYENTLGFISCAIGIVLFIALGFALMSKDSGFDVGKYSKENRAVERTKPKRTKIPTTFRMNKPCTISGKIASIISEISIVINHNGREIMVKFKGNEAKGFKVGDQVSVTCIPYRENPNGIILSNGSKISLMENGAKK